MAVDFVHPPLGDEVRAIGGGYTFLRDASLLLGGHDLYYLVGASEIDTSCCGVGGCGFAMVVGFVVEWKRREDADGRPVTNVEPVTDDALRQQIATHLKNSELVQEVQFWSPKEESP